MRFFFIHFFCLLSLTGFTQTAYITNYADDNVSVINVATNTVTATIPVGNGPNGVSVSLDGSSVYVANYGGTVSVINTATNTVSATIPVGNGSQGVCVSPDGLKVYVTNRSDNTVSVINTITNTETTTIPIVGSYPQGISVSPDGLKVYVTIYGGNVSVINTATNTVTATISVGTNPQGLAFSPDGSKVYVANFLGNTVSIINTSTNAVANTIAVGSNPYGVCVSPDGLKVYVANSGGTVSVINTATNTISTTIAAGSAGPRGISISPDGLKVYVAIWNNNYVRVINTATNTISATIAVGANPSAFGNFISTYSTPTRLNGKVYADLNGDCIFNGADYGISNYLVKAEPGPYYGLSNSNGDYFIYPDTGTYTISQATQNPLWQQTCQQTYQAVFTNLTDSIVGINFSNQILYYCSKLSVDIGGAYLRRCSNSYYTVSYCNNGTAAASNSIIAVDFGSHIIPQSSSIAWTSVNNNIYTFPVGDLDVGECGSFNINVFVSCSAGAGNTLCAHATIYPDAVCNPPDSAYDRRQLTVFGECIQNDSVQYVIKNIHYLNITHTGEYKIFVNNTLAQVQPYSLGQGDSLIVQFPANGNTIRLEVTFIDNNGTYVGPQVTIEGCGGNPVVQGQIGQLPENDEAENFETVCQIVGPHDPNDKSVTPSGLTSMHYIDENDDLEYLIRFQNTGTDTAFTVIIRDTISPFLDLATLVSGASSHTYTFDIYGQGIGEWTFSNILLPDSNVNEEASHGFVKYKIKQLSGNVQGTVINNSADIYFDFNEPVITNTTENIVHDTVLLCLNAVPAFNYSQNGASFEFSNNSDYATSYSWDFDDGNISSVENPSHTFTESGIYSVCLDANNECGTNSLCRIINLVITGAENINVNSIRVTPNPATSEITVMGYSPAYLKLCNTLGQTVTEASKSNKLYVGNLSQGLYVLQLFDANGQSVKTEKVIVDK